MGYPKTLEFSACSFLRVESPKWEVKTQAYYLGVVMDVNNEQNYRCLLSILSYFARQIWAKKILVYTKRIFYEDINYNGILILREVSFIYLFILIFQNVLRIWGKALHHFQKNKEYQKYILQVNFREFLDSLKLLHWSELKTPFLFATPSTQKMDWIRSHVCFWSKNWNNS